MHRMSKCLSARFPSSGVPSEATRTSYPMPCRKARSSSADELFSLRLSSSNSINKIGLCVLITASQPFNTSISKPSTSIFIASIRPWASMIRPNGLIWTSTCGKRSGSSMELMILFMPELDSTTSYMGRIASTGPIPILNASTFVTLFSWRCSFNRSKVRGCGSKAITLPVVPTAVE